MTTETTFGSWLRQQRRQLDLTQSELAQRIGYSVATIRKVERDELRPSKHLADLLAQAVNVAVTQRNNVINFARATPALPESVSGQPLHKSRPHNLPAQLTPFFGRTAEIVELTQQLTNPASRLITIVGPGGMGKTRLALEVAQSILGVSSQSDLADKPKLVTASASLAGSNIQSSPYEDGVYFVALAPLRTPEQIVPAIAEAINLRLQADSRLPKQQLFDYLRHKQLLLVLDNFEHLQAGVELILELLQACPTLRLFVTSRERLQLVSETLFVLESMALPSTATLPDVLSYSAVQLFVETARRVRPTFTLTPSNAQAIVRICQLVGAMPLGIILAAAWVDVLSPDAIVGELSQSFELLATELRDLPERQRSMRAVLAQSWQRLTDAEQAVFMRLAVFRGGFTRPAAQSVADASLRILSTLVNKALIQCDANGRYSIHELLRQYAETELAAANQTTDAQTAHCTYYTGFLQQREADLKGRQQVHALDEIEADFENVRAAWQWAVAERNYAAVGRAVESLYWFCEMRSRFQEESYFLSHARTALAPIGDEEAHPIWGQVMAYVVGQGLMAAESPLECKARLKTALRLARQQNSPQAIAFCHWRLALAHWQSEEFQEALVQFEQGITYYHRLGDRFYLGYLVKELGALHFSLDQPEKARTLVEQSLALRRETGDVTGLADSVGAVGWIAYHSGRYAEAEAYWQERRQLLHTLRIPHVLAENQFEFAWLAIFCHGDPATASTLAEEVQSVALEIKNTGSQVRMTLLFGLLAGLHEDYQRCRHYFQQIGDRHSFPFTASWALIGFALAACGLGDVSGAQQFIQRLFEIGLIHHWPSNVAKGLTFAAILAAQAGRAERATELLGLVFHHPLSPKGWLEQWPLIRRLRAELEITLTSEHFQAAWQRGQTLDLLATAQEQLTEWAGANGSTASLRNE